MQSSLRRDALNILVAPDSFKGSLTADVAAGHIARGIVRALPRSRVTQMPIADGGEGSAQAIAAALGGGWSEVSVTDANGKAVQMPYAQCEGPQIGTFAVFDVAAVVGLPDAVLPPQERTTRGVGQAIRALHGRGYRTIVVGLGGSSTMDAGAGMLSEVALSLSTGDERPLFPTYRSLPEIAHVSRREDSAWLDEIRLIALSDVSSPLTGPAGASHVFGRQKGFLKLDEADRVVSAFAALCEASLSQHAAHLPGAGAAGGLGFGLMLMGAQVVPGAQFILEAAGLSRSIDVYDWVIAGEGKSDGQTVLGKGPALLAKLARGNGVPVSLLSGAVETTEELDEAFDGCFSIMSGPESLQYAMENAGPLLENAGFRLARLFASALAAGVARSDVAGREAARAREGGIGNARHRID